MRSLTAAAWIERLYRVEAEARERGLGAEAVRALRREKSKPLLDGLGEWIRARRAEALPKSPVGQAVAYTSNNWAALNRRLDDGDLAIDNSLAERTIRPVALGRKNRLFAGSDRGGRTAAVLPSFTQTCKDLGIDPFSYLRDVLARISSHPMKNLADLLPDNYLNPNP
jgi:hypothetical protein